MSSLTTLSTLLAFLEQTRFVFSTCGSPENNLAAVTITGNSIAYGAYYECTTITSLIIASTVTSFGIYIIITTIPTKMSTNI